MRLFLDMNAWWETLHHLLLLLLLLLFHETHSFAHPHRLPNDQRDHRKVVTVAYFNHEAIWVMKEELVYVDAAFLDSPLDAGYAHLFQLLLHQAHALALDGKDISVTSRCVICFFWLLVIRELGNKDAIKMLYL